MARTASAYSSTIDGFKVESNYLPDGNITFCNVFAQAVMKAMSAALPTGQANDIANALYGNGTPGWYSVTFLDAQKRANLGYPTVALRAASGNGHIVVVRPKGSSITTLKEVLVAQAGRSNFNSKTINYSWPAEELPEVKFYTHD
ncbi:hypothetical protein [Paenibacillus tengchongensis]|uniref:hypothetical protein n=1 Tax=Paenibacillus tengchongensis TaxID=2608684 RepID=UPI00124D3F94|nr:hypothetical protein [Paenibacillus tengchongensis]